MLTQSLHFEITGQDAHHFLKACHDRGVEPVQAFETFVMSFLSQTDVQNDIDRKKSRAGGLAKYANPELISLEEQAVEMALREKYATH